MTEDSGTDWGEAERMQLIRDKYNVPAWIGGRVLFNGYPGFIVGTSGGFMRIRIDGRARSTPVHPTWRMKYLSAPVTEDAETD